MKRNYFNLAASSVLFIMLFISRGGVNELFAQTNCPTKSNLLPTYGFVGILNSDNTNNPPIKPLHVFGDDDCPDLTIRLSTPQTAASYYSANITLPRSAAIKNLYSQTYNSNVNDFIISATDRTEDIILTTRNYLGNIRFATTPVADGPDYERMTITPGGYIGIGILPTSTPMATLDVNVTQWTNKIRLQMHSTNNLPSLRIYRGSLDENSIGWWIENSDENGGSLLFKKTNICSIENPASQTTTTYVSLKDNGNFGIGYSNPGSKLVVKAINDLSTASALNVTNSSDESLLFVRNDGKIGINSISPSSKLFIKASTSDNSASALNIVNSNENSIFFVNNNGNIGINSINPSSKLTIRATTNDNTASALNITNPDDNSIFFVNNDGNIGINVTNPTSKLLIKGSTNDNTASAFSLINSDEVSLFFVNNEGKIGIGTNSPSQKLHLIGNAEIGEHWYEGTMNNMNYRLAVDGQIVAREIIVNNTDDETHWADFVFNDDYQLMALDELDLFIKDNKHLPGVPTADEIKEKGNNLGKTEVILLQKIEELTLYLIELKKEVKQLKEERRGEK